MRERQHKQGTGMEHRIPLLGLGGTLWRMLPGEYFAAVTSRSGAFLSFGGSLYRRSDSPLGEILFPREHLTMLKDTVDCPSWGLGRWYVSSE